MEFTRKFKGKSFNRLNSESGKLKGSGGRILNNI